MANLVWPFLFGFLRYGSLCLIFGFGLRWIGDTFVGLPFLTAMAGLGMILYVIWKVTGRIEARILDPGP